ncbi:MAG TPA: rod shape-determining protein MreD [Anaerolineales bacterium]|nr:rod shape-determining protein MreD [Anaerolineales bacterium]
MAAYLIGVPLMAFLAILQSSVLGTLRVLDGSPDLVLIAVVSWSLTGRMHESMILALVGGLFLDLLSGAPFGMTAIGLVLVAYLVSFLEGRFWEANFLIPLGVMSAAAVIYHSVVVLAAAVSGRPIDLALAFSRVFLPSALFDVLLALPAAQFAVRARDALFPPRVKVG